MGGGYQDSRLRPTTSQNISHAAIFPTLQTTITCQHTHLDKCQQPAAQLDALPLAAPYGGGKGAATQLPTGHADNGVHTSNTLEPAQQQHGDGDNHPR